MSSLEAPSTETFEPVRSYRKLGLDFISLRSDDGVRLELSQAGVEAMDQNLEIAPLLDRMGAFVAEHGGYHDVDKVKAVEPGDIHRVAEDKQTSRSYGRNRRLASVYRHDSAPSVIVKAHDYHRRSAGFQFYLGAWLHAKLADADNGLHANAQLGLMQAPGFVGHRTVIMDYVPGENLKQWLFISQSRAFDAAAIFDEVAVELVGSVRRNLRETLGWRGALATNDIGNYRNIMLTDPENVHLDNLEDQEVVLIDQPAVYHRLPLPILTRYMPTMGGLRAEQPTSVQKPAALSG